MTTSGVKPAARARFSGRPFNARFTDVAAKAGLRESIVYGDPGHVDYIVETMGAGIAFLDFDNDGWLDIFVLSGSRLDAHPAGAGNRLYRNNRNGTFTDITERAGVGKSGWAMGVTIGDYNNDGFEDIFVTYWGQNVLYRNNGDGTFTDVTREAGLARPQRWGSGCTWIDYDRDGKLDLFVSNYLVFDRKNIPRAGMDPNCNLKGVRVNCGPRGLPAETHLLFHNNGDGTFTDVTERSGIAKAARTYGMTAVAGDFDGDGWPDIVVAADSTQSLFFRNNRDGTFSEEGLERGIALSDNGHEQAGMGVAAGDFNTDGRLDLFKTHFLEDIPGLYRNGGQGNFTDVTLASGLAVETGFICWGTGFEDFDNDGLPDIFIATGSVFPEIEKKLPQYPARTRPLLFRNLGNGAFEPLNTEAGPALAIPHSSRGVAFGDFDNDGDIDILIMNQNEPPSLLRNDVTGANRWLKVKLIGTLSNRSAIGGQVTVEYGGRRQVRQVAAQSSYLSVNDSRLHFGLGGVESCDVNVRWPNGSTESFKGIESNQLVVMREGTGIVARDKFKRSN